MMMDVKENLQDIFRRIFDDDSILLFDEMTADDIEDWDSLMHIDLILEIEKVFSIKFTTEEVLKTSNVGEFIRLIENKI
jgi:Acyl carrier protein